MFYGWSLFSYSKQIFNEEDRISYCNTRIDKLSQPLFLDDPSDEIFIYSTASRTLELILDDKDMSVRLFLWEETKTINIVIEKIPIAQAQIEIKGRKVLFNRFEINFYNGEELETFKAEFCSRKQVKANGIGNDYINSMLEYKKTKDKSIFEPNKENQNFINNMPFLSNGIAVYNEFNCSKQPIWHSTFSKDPRNNFIKATNQLDISYSNKKEPEEKILFIKNFISKLKILNGPLIYKFNRKIRIHSKRNFLECLKKLIKFH